MGDLWNTYVLGGNMMHAITLCAALSLTVIAHKLVVFRRVRLKLDPFVSQVRAALLKDNVKAAIEVCEQHPSPVASVIKSGLLKVGRSRDEIEKTMENTAIHEVAYLENHLPVVATVTGLAPLLGLLGTVAGMFIAFRGVAGQGGNDVGAVARGTSVALLTTAWGLIVACFSQPFYNYFVSRVAATTREIETAANLLLETLDEMERAGTTQAVGRM